MHISWSTGLLCKVTECQVCLVSYTAPQRNQCIPFSCLHLQQPVKAIHDVIIDRTTCHSGQSITRGCQTLLVNVQVLRSLANAPTSGELWSRPCSCVNRLPKLTCLQVVPLSSQLRGAQELSGDSKVSGSCTVRRRYVRSVPRIASTGTGTTSISILAHALGSCYDIKSLLTISPTAFAF